MRIRPGNAQHIGSRNQQQDSFAFTHIEDALLVRRAGVLAVLADGMGGLAMGKEASDCAVKATLSLHKTVQRETSPTEILQRAVESANMDVLTMARKAGVEGEAGSTLVAAIVKDNKLYWTSVGDSRIYLYRSGELVQLTTEQNLATELLQRVADGRMSIEEARSHPDRAALTNFIGNPEIKPADSSLHPLPIFDGDWIVLCSDGLFGTLTDDEIREALSGNPNDSCERLIQKVVSRNKPHQDNTTVAILACNDRESATVRTKRAIGLDKFFTSEPQPKKIRRISILMGLLVALVIVFLAIWRWPYICSLSQKHSPEKESPKAEPIQKPPQGPIKIPMSKDTPSNINANAK